MSDQPQQNTDITVLHTMKKVNFQLYRRGNAVFHLESRKQGEIRKVTQATYKEAIMTDDSISVTLVSTKRLDFKLRDYIVYYNRPYFINRLPEVDVDGSKRYIYTITFEGTIYELGRIAFILRNAHGYDFNGTLAEFGRLIVENLNKANEWIEWSYEGRTYKGRFLGSYEYDGTLYYRWLNRQGQVLNVNYLITADRHPSAGDNGLSPTGVATTSTVTSYHQWTLDFPVATTVPPVYPDPTETHLPDDECSVAWKEPEFEDMTDAINAETREKTKQSIRENSPQGIPYEYDQYTKYPLHDYFYPPQATLEHFEALFPDVKDAYEWYEERPLPSQSTPSSPTDEETIQQRGIFAVQHQRMRCIGEHDESIPVGDPDQYAKYITRGVTYKAQLQSQTEWHIEPVTPPSGAATSDDYPTESVLLAYDSHSCLAVIQDLPSHWEGWEWRISSEIEYGCVNGEMLVCGTIIMRQGIQNTDTVHVMSLGRSGGIANIKKKYADEGNLPSRVYFYGGNQNLPQYYRNTRLCLPGYSKEESYIDFSEIDPSPLPLAIDNQTCEEVKLFDDIYPACKPFIIQSWWPEPQIIDETITTEYGTTTKHYLLLRIPKDEFFLINDKWKDWIYPIGENDYDEWLILKQQQDTQDNRDRYIEYYIGKSKYQNGSDTPYITFQTGKLAGYKLSVHDTYIEEKVSEGKLIYLFLNVVREDNEEFHDAEDTNPAVPEADYTPNANYCCWYGDKFIVEGINMPVAYTYYKDGSAGDFSAENYLWQEATQYMCDKVANIGYELDVARDYVVKHRTLYRCFDTMQFPDATTDDAIIRKRISSVELDLVDGFKYKVEISNYKKKNALAVLGKIISQHNEQTR